VRSCLVVSDRPGLAAWLTAALKARSIECHPAELAYGFAETANAVNAVVDATGPIDAVVVALADDGPTASPTEGWERVLAEHRSIIEDLHADSAWSRAAADYAAGADRPVRLVTLTDATTTGGRSRAQASAQQARVAAASTHGRITAYAVSVEAAEAGTAPPAAALVAHLLADPETAALVGAELVVGAGWLGLRGHPRPIGSVTYGGPALPDWLDATLREIVGGSS
jgi:hypothetical protein